MKHTTVEVLTTRVIAGFIEETLIDRAAFKDVEDVDGFVTLDQIKDVVTEIVGEGCIDVWYELGIRGYIYRYSPDRGWSKHGETRGFA